MPSQKSDRHCLNPYDVIKLILSTCLLRRQEFIQQACNEVRQLAPLLYAQGINPTHKNIRHFMSKPSALWKKEVVEALSEARRFLE
ncbi:MAG: hypothetical protein QNJ65_06870 [Xenococcaceae cyanobacterium MO_234.B1]|nr:hypothetical protein [Xenococcaceae cyanobacterium MO_234.B1]